MLHDVYWAIYTNMVASFSSYGIICYVTLVCVYQSKMTKCSLSLFLLLSLEIKMSKMTSVAWTDHSDCTVLGHRYGCLLYRCADFTDHSLVSCTRGLLWGGGGWMWGGYVYFCQVIFNHFTYISYILSPLTLPLIPITDELIEIWIHIKLKFLFSICISYMLMIYGSNCLISCSL